MPMFILYVRRSRGNGVVDMPVAALEKVIQQLADYGVRHFEITGGESFRTPDSNAIVEMIASRRKRQWACTSLDDKWTWNSEIPRCLLDAFDEYIRISFCEAAHAQLDKGTDPSLCEAYSQWKGNVCRLLAAKRTHLRRRRRSVSRCF